ncbi:hypothetical protein C8F04DRAFT_1185606 [Mycena alexandri]|uniref:Uncharacterized protein n=1 Tax=Mycena alexandri TaxID=1745969 RepID=A0AAD6X135_9AGAR|nr:hypothetical protein C8F04DRAFT_1185606 [Mycena alexandri]
MAAVPQLLFLVSPLLSRLCSSFTDTRPTVWPLLLSFIPFTDGRLAEAWAVGCAAADSQVPPSSRVTTILVKLRSSKCLNAKVKPIDRVQEVVLRAVGDEQDGGWAGMPLRDVCRPAPQAVPSHTGMRRLSKEVAHLVVDTYRIMPLHGVSPPALLTSVYYAFTSPNPDWHPEL